MNHALTYAYLTGWAAISILTALVAWRVQDRWEPPLHPLVVRIIAGAASPMLIVGLIEAGAVALTQEALRANATLPRHRHPAAEHSVAACDPSAERRRHPSTHSLETI